jgi:hypothetical protein
MSNDLRSTILTSRGLAPVPVPCPEWGEDVVVWIHPLTGDQRDALEGESTELAAAEDFAPGSGEKRLTVGVLQRDRRMSRRARPSQEGQPRLESRAAGRSTPSSCAPLGASRT